MFFDGFSYFEINLILIKNDKINERFGMKMENFVNDVFLKKDC